MEEYFVELVKDATLKYIFPETMVGLTEQQFSREELSFGRTFWIADIFKQNKLQ